MAHAPNVPYQRLCARLFSSFQAKAAVQALSTLPVQGYRVGREIKICKLKL